MMNFSLSCKQKEQVQPKNPNNRYSEGSYWDFEYFVCSDICLFRKSCLAPTMCTVQFNSVTQLCLTLRDPMDCSTPGLPVHHQLPELTQLTSVELEMPSNHLILCRPLLLLPSIFPSIGVFSNESVLRIRWPKYCSISFNINPSNE